MRVSWIEDKPFYEIESEVVTLRRVKEIVSIPCLRAQVDGLPDELDALVAAGDLQGREPSYKCSDEPRLLGQLLADELELLSEVGEIPPLERVGVVLAGDLFARTGLDRRGGMGDVRDVWLALAAQCRWVTGVAGNHDVFGLKPSLPDFRAFCGSPGVHFLDGKTLELDGLRIAGLSGVIGRSTRPWRRDEDGFLGSVAALLQGAPDLLVMHDGPDVPELGLRGIPAVRELLETHRRELLLVRGHAYWEEPLVSIGRDVQVLNVDSRIMVLTRPKRQT